MRKLAKPREDLQRAISSMTSKVSMQLSALKKQIGRLQQRARENRELRQKGKQSEKRQRGERGSFL